MQSLRSFLLVLAGLLGINAVVAGLIWAKHRTPYYRSNFFLWVTGIASFVVQGLFPSGRWMISSFGVSVFVFNLFLCDLVRQGLEVRAPWRTHVAVFAVGFSLSQLATMAKLPFWMQALPMSMGTALPLVDLLYRSLRLHGRPSSVTTRCTLFAAALFVVHQLDYAFFRLDPVLGSEMGFIPAFLAAFALSVTTPSMLLERTALENARLYHEAQRAIAARDEFLMVASHELRTPLNSLRLTVQGLSSRVLAASPDRFGNLLRLAERQTDKMARLVDLMLSFSTPEAVRKSLRFASTDLVAVAHDVVDSYREDLAQTGSVLAMAGAEHAVGLWDRAAIEKALGHVLSNAIKFGSGKPIELSIEEHHGHATCVVQDHGIGIAAERLPYIANRFERGVSARQYGGLGLGLFIVRSIVEAHGGGVEVTSTVGAGTRVSLDLPQEGPAT